ncbi:hypothetical protein [Campylobacter concisus]|uniref:Uncharacterized protein n=1 Tax=Campylobacter concisus (strain 13826) TaxID=360104 RepID=A7ZGG4_CAMC1|nr:hypothetical protein [Campylobacter concisus]EAT97535.1 hypothetical protein CCC13826_0621 [Campylobacter concisus 13826]
MLKYLELAVCGTNLKPTYPFIGSIIRDTFGHALRYASYPYISQECDTILQKVSSK